jgi:hypothetical protein
MEAPEAFSAARRLGADLARVERCSPAGAGAWLRDPLGTFDAITTAKEDTLMRTILFAVSSLVLGACGGHMAMYRGSVVTRPSDTQVQVCMGKNEVTTGDQVILYHNICSVDPWAACRRAEPIEGRVTKVFDEHYAMVEVPAGTSLVPGDIAVKAQK